MILSFPWTFWSFITGVILSQDLVVSLKVVCQGKDATHSKGRLTRIADSTTPCVRIVLLVVQLYALDEHDVD